MTKESITSHKLGSQDFKVNQLCLLYSTAGRYCLLHLIKQNYVVKNFLETLILMTQVSLYLFSLLELTNLKLHNISITPWLVKKIISIIGLGKAICPDCIPVVVLKNFEPGLLYILAELFNICQKEFCFLDCLKAPLVVPVFKNFGERCMAKNYHPVSLLSFVNKVF